MTIPFMLYAAGIGVALAFAGRLLEARAALRRRPRRWVWAVMLTTLVVLAAAMPWRDTAARVAPGGLTGVAASTAASSSGQRDAWAAVRDAVRGSTDRIIAALVPFDTLASWLWMLGSAVLFAAYVVGQWTLRRQSRRWRGIRVRNVPVLLTPDVGPAIVGAWAPRIVMPAWALDLDETQTDLLLRHELEHQRAHDARLVHLAALVPLLMPWNPVAWWMVSRLRVAVEVDCDARVLGRPASADDGARERAAYGELLLAVASRASARSSHLAPALLEHPSTLNRRISAMFPEPQRLLHARAFAAFTFAMALTAAAVAAPVPTPQTGNDKAAYDSSTKNLVLPKTTHSQKPVYTPEAMRQKIQGQVELSVVVNKDGHVDDATITKSLDQTYGLDQESLLAAKQWIFEPGRLNGKAVPVRVALTMTFTLH